MQDLGMTQSQTTDKPKSRRHEKEAQTDTSQQEHNYSKVQSNPVLSGHSTCSKRRPKIGFQDRLSLNACQKHCIMLQRGSFCNTFKLH